MIPHNPNLTRRLTVVILLVCLCATLPVVTADRTAEPVDRTTGPQTLLTWTEDRSVAGGFIERAETGVGAGTGPHTAVGQPPYLDDSGRLEGVSDEGRQLEATEPRDPYAGVAAVDGVQTRSSTLQPPVRDAQLPASSDYDGDGLSNVYERSIGTDFTSSDTDNDGLSDVAELYFYQTSPTDDDTDGDGIADFREVKSNSRLTTEDGSIEWRHGEQGTLGQVQPDATPVTRGDTVESVSSAQRDDGLLRRGTADSTESSDVIERDAGDPSTESVSRSSGPEGSPGVVDTARRSIGSASVTVSGVAPEYLVLVALSALGGAAVWLSGRDHSPGSSLVEGIEARLPDSPDSAVRDTVLRPGSGPTLSTLAPSAEESTAETGPPQPDETSPHAEDSERESAARGEPQVPLESPDLDDASGQFTGNEVLSDEERVERMLRTAGGRLKQADIVAETDWSKSKVSRLLSGMAEDGRVEKVRLGRENLICLEEYETEAIVNDGAG